MTIGQKVYVAEVGYGARPAVVERVLKAHSRCDSNDAMVIENRIDVTFTDERGGFRDCYASSVFATKEEAEESLS